MRYIFKSALIGLAALGCVTISHSFAGAQELELRVGPGGVGIYDRDRDRDRYYDRRYRPARLACDPDDALDSARDAGLPSRSYRSCLATQRRGPRLYAPWSRTDGICQRARMPRDLKSIRWKLSPPLS